MKYRNKSRNKMLLALPDGVKEILPNQIFESATALDYAFLELVEEKPKVSKAPRKKKISVKKTREEKVNGSYSTSS